MAKGDGVVEKQKCWILLEMGVMERLGVMITMLAYYIQVIALNCIFLRRSHHTMGKKSIKIAKKVFLTFDNIFHVYLMRGFQKYGRN